MGDKSFINRSLAGQSYASNYSRRARSIEAIETKAAGFTRILENDPLSIDREISRGGGSATRV